MSRSQPRSINPAKMYAQWSGSEGSLSHYDKESAERVDIPFPFTFLVLDELNTIKGYSDADRSGFWSNEVRNITKDKLTVKTSKGTKGQGTWAQLENLKSKGAKYAKSIYIAYKDETGELVLGNLSVSGAALTAWIEFNKRYDVYKGAVVITGPSKAKKKGATTYYEPEFEGKDVSEATDAAATELDKQLQSYLGAYFNRADAIEEEVVAEDFDEPEAEEQEEEAPSRSKVKEEASVEKEDNKIDLSEVPF